MRSTRFMLGVLMLFAAGCSLRDTPTSVTTAADRPSALVAGDTTSFAWLREPYITFRPELNGSVRISHIVGGRVGAQCGGVYLDGIADRAVLTHESCVAFSGDSLVVDAWVSSQRVVRIRANQGIAIARCGQPDCPLAIVYLRDTFPGSVRRHRLSPSATDFLRPFSLAGFGRTGNAITGGAFPPAESLLEGRPLMVSGTNLMESSCSRTVTATTCSVSGDLRASSYGALLLADQDVRGLAPVRTSFLCAFLRYCAGATSREISPAGESPTASSPVISEAGTPAISSFGAVMAIAAPSSAGPVYPLLRNGVAGSTSVYVCVAAWGSGNPACQRNADWVIRNTF